MNVVKRPSIRQLDLPEQQANSAAGGGACRFFYSRRGKVKDASRFDPIFWN